MPTPSRLQLRIEDPDNVLCPVMGFYTDYLVRSRYGAKRLRRYIASALHFGDWLRSHGNGPGDIDEVLISRFLTGHLLNCSCDYPTPHGVILNRAALNNLLRVLRTHDIAAGPAPDAIELELVRFDAKMRDVWGLTQGTRDHRRRIIRRLLRQEVGAGPIQLGAISRNAVRAFVLGDANRSTSTVRVMAGAVRCYLRYRALMGDDIAHLGKAVPRPAFWRAANLPEILSAADVEQLFTAFDKPCPSRRRGYAIVRCQAVAQAACTLPALADRPISPDTIRHTTAMHLLQSGVDITVIALWLGHEHPSTTHIYMEADLAMKEQALSRLQPIVTARRRYRPPDQLMAFLQSL